jgi:hypothetical protein
MEPILDPEIMNQVTWLSTDSEASHHTLPIGPMKWVVGTDNRRIAVATGKVDDEQRMSEIFSLE